MLEQHSALALQLVLSILQMPPPQTPPLQPSEQQSSALLHATPLAKQKSRHLTCPVPDSGSQRPLQQVLLVGLQAVPGASQDGDPAEPALPEAPPVPPAPPAPPTPPTPPIPPTPPAPLIPPAA